MSSRSTGEPLIWPVVSPLNSAGSKPHKIAANLAPCCGISPRVAPCKTRPLHALLRGGDAVDWRLPQSGREPTGVGGGGIASLPPAPARQPAGSGGCLSSRQSPYMSVKVRIRPYSTARQTGVRPNYRIVNRAPVVLQRTGRIGRTCPTCPPENRRALSG